MYRNNLRRARMVYHKEPVLMANSSPSTVSGAALRSYTTSTHLRGWVQRSCRV